MPRIKTITLYKYDELNDASKGKARDAFRICRGESGDNSFSLPIIDDFKVIAAFMGWTVTDTPWSGFASQGDGAQFIGRWAADRVNAKGLKEHAPVTDAQTGTTPNQELHILADRFAALAILDKEGEAEVSASGRYCHERANDFDVTFPGLSDEKAGAAEEELIAASRDLMRWLYRSLEREYDFQESDEQVAETLRDNELEFTDDGRAAGRLGV